MDGPQHASRAVRRHWPGVLGAGLIATAAFAVPGAAQNLADVQRELSEMRRHYDAALKRLQRDYGARIRHLETQLRAAQKKSAPDSAPLAKPSTEPLVAAFSSQRAGSLSAKAGFRHSWLLLIALAPLLLSCANAGNCPAGTE
jgi:hypothetical protein